jgi:hypothetical protein
MNMNMSRTLQMKEIQQEGLELFRRKNADYGDAFATYGSIGVLVRIGDKIKRLMSISSNQICLVNDESMYDTLLDLHNYAAMALMLLKEHDKQTDALKTNAEEPKTVSELEDAIGCAWHTDL